MTESVFGLFGSPSEAEKVIGALVNAGISRGNIKTLSSNDLSESSSRQAEDTADETNQIGGSNNFFESLVDANPDEADSYQEALSQGAVLVVVTATDDDKLLDRATTIMEAHDEVDIDQSTGHLNET